MGDGGEEEDGEEEDENGEEDELPLFGLSIAESSPVSSFLNSSSSEIVRFAFNFLNSRASS